LIRETILPIDAETILLIKLLDRRPGDFLAWATFSAAPFGDKTIWKLLWKSKIPIKVRIFAWKALSDGLATEMNKMRRHILVSGVCQICGHEREDVFHVLLKCLHAATF
jgi:hypothetical protein